MKTTDEEKELLFALTRNDFSRFTQKVFTMVSPGSTYRHNWHLDCISEYLMACERRDIKRLIINIPPRFMKSIICSIAFPAWLLGRDPSTQMICSSYAMGLAESLSVDCRLILESPWYQKLFPNTKLVSDQNTKKRFVTTERGARYAAGVGGTITGHGGDYLIVDDPLNAKEQDSVVIRESANRWHDRTWTTRLNDPKTGVMILIMQRLHMNDLTGHLLEQGGWEHLKIPLIAEEDKLYDFGRFKRLFKEGETLHPERIGELEIASLKRQLGPYGFAGQYQQTPSPEGGGEFRREWIEYYDKIDIPSLNLYMFIDPANSKKSTSDYTVICMLGLGPDENVYLVDMVRDKLNLKEREDMIFQMHRRYRPKLVVYEKYGMQIDADFMRQAMEHRNYRFYIEEVGGILRKEERIKRLQTYFSDHRVYLPRVLHKTNYEGKVVDIVQEFIEEEYSAFPVGLHDDMMDAMSRLCDIQPIWPGVGEIDYYALYRER